jgi:hypothetical protein
MSLNLLFDGKLQSTVHQYHPPDVDALRSKLAQYPSGTTFHVTPSSVSASNSYP